MKYVKEFENTSAKNQYLDEAPTGTFVTPAATNWTTGENGIPSGWTRVDA